MNGEKELLVQIPSWQELAWLRHGFSTRHGGVSTVYRRSNDLNLGWTRDDDSAHVGENRRRLIAAVCGRNFEALNSEGPDSETPLLITVRQVHSEISLMVPEVFRPSDFVTHDGKTMLEADGLMTAATGILLGIQTADCVPVFVVDTRLRAVANFHAGWRGTAARIVERGVAKMIAGFGSRPEDMIAAIGPSIGACCYSVGDEVHQTFAGRFAYSKTLFSHAGPESPLYLDLWEANRRQLLDSGLSADRISVVGECTGCTGLPGMRRYFSHRRENGFTGRMLSVIGLA